LASALIGGGAGLLKEGRELIGEFAPKQEQSAPAPHFDYHRLQDPIDIAGRSARYHLLQLHREFDAPNIQRVDVNGVKIRPKPGERAQYHCRPETLNSNVNPSSARLVQ
jgi:hypothetical protein